ARDWPFRPVGQDSNPDKTVSGFVSLRPPWETRAAREMKKRIRLAPSPGPDWLLADFALGERAWQAARPYRHSSCATDRQSAEAGCGVETGHSGVQAEGKKEVSCSCCWSESPYGFPPG